MQTITQTEIGRLGKHLFNQGAAVNPGSVNVNNTYEFIKLQDASLPSGTWVGTNLISGTNSIGMEVLEAIDAEGSDPPTLFVRYTFLTTKLVFQGEYVLPNNNHVSKHSSVVRCNKMFLMIKGYLSLFDESVRTFN